MKQKFSIAMSLAVILAMLLSSVALASDVDITSVVDVTAPTGSVTLAPGANGAITINMSVTGNQVGTATFEVYRDWTLSGGAFVGSNPQQFTVDPRAGGDPATIFSTTGSVTVDAGQANGTFTLVVSAFDITNSNTTGAKLSDGRDATYSVTVFAPPTPPPPSDTSAPVISYTVNGVYPAAPDGENGWFVGDAYLDWTVTDPESSFTTVGCNDTLVNSDTTGATFSCSATSAGGTAGPVTVTIKRDATPPSVSVALDRDAASSNWFNEVTGAPIAEFTCSDDTSLIATCPTDYTFGEGADQSHSGNATDNAGNSASAEVNGVYVDLTDPGITWSDVQNFFYGFPPATPPSCQASDDLSGAADCSVAGYDPNAGTGTHALTATAHDVAGNTATGSNSYEVMAWTLRGFYQPVDMNGIWNTVKGGSTVPFKFEIFAGSTELKLTSYVKGFNAVAVACPSTGYVADDIEVLATGGTSLRFDTTGDQFIYNWQTPRSAGACYRVTMTTQDGSTLSANFKLK